MRAVLQRWGNSHAIRIPMKIINILELSENDPLDMSVVDGTLTIKKAVKVGPQTLRELYENHYGVSMDEIVKNKLIEHGEEFSWGGVVGLEEW